MAPVQYVNAANGVRYAYRFFDPGIGIPLVIHNHFRGNMDLWDPALIQPLARARPVILFDNAGVGRSTGTIPDTYLGWARGVMAFIEALGIRKVDLLGFSMGGRCVQMVALEAPHLIRKLICAGTDTSMPATEMISWPRGTPQKARLAALSKSETVDEFLKAIAYSFFNEDNEGQAAAAAYTARICEGQLGSEVPLLQPLDVASSKRQTNAAVEWASHKANNAHDRLQELKMPVLVLNGDNDLLIPSSRSWELYAGIPNAQLIMYPRSGHGFLYQYAPRVAKDINAFLESGVNSLL